MFKDQCSEKVEQIMTKEAKHQEDTLVKRKDSADKENRLKYVRTLLPKKFPGQSWFIEQRPPEVKLMNDHTTGVCKVFALLLLWLILFLLFLLLLILYILSLTSTPVSAPRPFC